MLYRPAEFRRNNIAVLHRHIAALPQRLDAVHLRVCDLYLIRIPQRRPAELRHLRVSYGQPVIVPEGITEIAEDMVHPNIAALLERALSVRRTVKGRIFQKNIMAAVQRPLLIKSFIFNRRHLDSSLSEQPSSDARQSPLSGSGSESFSSMLYYMAEESE